VRPQRLDQLHQESTSSSAGAKSSGRTLRTTTRIAEGAVLGCVFSPYTFDVLEVMRNSLPSGWMVLVHSSENLVQLGDYAYMLGCE
jgi:hypothetical protein